MLVLWPVRTASLDLGWCGGGVQTNREASCSTHQRLRLDPGEFDAFVPRSMRRRSASERGGLSGCRAAQASISATFSSDNRNVLMGSRPVAGRPIFFFGITFCIDIRTNGITNSLAIGIRFRPRPVALFISPNQRADHVRKHATGSNPEHGDYPCPRLLYRLANSRAATQLPPRSPGSPLRRSASYFAQQINACVQSALSARGR